jgi:uncharacterized Tic20 family protein
MERFEIKEAIPLPPEGEKQACMWGMLCHLTALTAFIGIPFGHIIGPLVVWLFKKKEYSFVDGQGRESLNFQISMSIYCIVASALIFVLIGFALLIGLAIADFILVVIAAVRTSNGKPYRYPLTIRFFK